MNAADPDISTHTNDKASVDQLAHLTCCRGQWLVSLCGMRDLAVELGEPDDVCAMCVEELVRLRPSALHEAERICPYDGDACPSPQELDAKAERLLGLDL